MTLLDVRLVPFVIKLEFKILSVSFRALEMRLSILDFKFFVKLFVVSPVKFNSIADTPTNEVVKMAMILNAIIIPEG